MKKFLLTSSVILSGLYFTSAKEVIVAADSFFQKVMTEIFNPLFQAGIIITFIYFLYGVMKYVINLDNLEERAKAQQHLLWGLVGVFIVFSIGGIINTLNTVFGGILK